MLIDHFLPRYDVKAQYHIDVHASVEKAYAAAQNLDMRESWIIRLLYLLRGLPQYSLTLDGMLKMGFVLLADKPSQEIVYGLIGWFWTRSAHLQSVTADNFVAFDRPGFAKAVGNIAFTPEHDGSVRVTTETRIFCLDAASRRRFRLYWTLIGPFSGMVRKEWLRLIKKRAEITD